MFNSVDFKNKSHQDKTLFFLKSYSTGRTHREMCFAFHLNWKEIKPVHPQGTQSWIVIGRTDGWNWNSNTLATWCEELTHWKRPWCWERLKAGEGDNRGWDGWMASPTQMNMSLSKLVLVMNREAWCAAVCGSQRVGQDWATELN